MTQLLSGTRFLLRYRICAAHDPCMQAGAATLRNRVFVQEQRVFTDHDRDAIDEHALPLVAIGEDAAGGGHREGTECARISRACPDAECGSVPPHAWDSARRGGSAWPPPCAYAG